MADGRYLAGRDVGIPVPRDEIDDAGQVAGGERVTDRLIGQARPEKPGAGPLVQNGQGFRLLPGQLTAEHLREKMVIAEPLAGLVERHDEEIFPIENVDYRGGVGLPVNGFAERGGETVEN